MSTPKALALPGYRCGQIISRSSSSTCWAALGPQEEPVILRHRRLPPPAARAYRHQLSQLRRAAHPRCVRIRDFAPVADGVLEAIDAQPGVVLSTWLRERGGLRPAALERLTASLADALAHLHEHGLRAGRIDPDRVMLAASGQAQLDVSGAAPEAASIASDLASLALLAAHCGQVSSPAFGEPELDQDLARLLDEAAAQGEATTVDAATLRAVAEAAVRRREQLAAAAGEESDDGAEELADLAGAAVRAHILASPTRRRPTGRWRPALARIAVLVLGAALGIGGASTADGLAAADVPGAASATTQPFLTPAQAFRVRDLAVATGNRQLLASAVVPGSPAWAHDVALLVSIGRSGTAIRGLRTAVVAGPGGLWVRQLAHLRLREQRYRRIPAQPAYCVTVTADEQGRLAATAHCL